VGLLRLRLATQLSLILCGISVFSTGLAVILQERSLSAELERAAHQRLERAASAADQLVERHLEAISERYRAISKTPELRANLDVRDGPTLGFFAAQLARQQEAELILFLDARNEPRVRSGDKQLGKVVRSVLAAGRKAAAAADPPGETPATRLLAHDGRLFAVSVTALHTRDRRVGQLVALERISDELLTGWSELCGARIHFGAPEPSPRALDLVVRTLGDFELRVEGSLDAEHEALVLTRRKLLAAGVIAVVLAFASSFFLARRWVQPILEVQDATERIGRGDLDVRLRVERGDEIGDVARAVDHMAERLATTLGEVRHLAYHDTLTGLGNRRLFKERLSLALEEARRDALGVAVLFLDLDHFKFVNDTLGHTLGDQLLKESADRIVATLRRMGPELLSRGRTNAVGVSRFGGDEFTILLPGVADLQHAGSLARCVLEALASPFKLDGHEVTVGASIGISTYPADGRDVETLLRNCDTAMYHAKQKGRNQYQYFAEYMNVVAAKRLVLEAKLRRAIENEELQLHYQPKVELETGRIVGLEALARWREEDLGAVPPCEFVPLAEESGLIHEMGDWVLRTAIRQVADWQQVGLPPLRVAVNLSAHQMERNGLVERIAELLDDAGVEPDCLEVEVTESVLMEDEDAAIEVLAALRTLGIHVSLDDFGTGYSSLSYLRRLPIDTVKIDQAFIQNVDEDSEDAAIASAIISLAKVLGLRSVVEGVETEEQHAFLREIGCDEIQGFLVSTAVTADEVPMLVERLSRRRRAKRPRRAAIRRRR
jgi:diguanylate cyclase (GGDEF)-like protein